MHSNTSFLEVVEITLSNDQLDALIKQGEKVTNQLKEDKRNPKLC